jgi:hypothetical protein
VLALLVIVFLAAAPFVALASGSWALATARQAQLAERASSFQVPALVLKPEAPSGGWYGDLGAQARWTAHDGTVITGNIPVPLGAAAGSTQWLWTTADGQLANPPLEDSQVTGQAHVAEGFSVFTLAVLLTITGLVTRWTLDKRRMAAWDTEWRSTGPRWTTRALGRGRAHRSPRLPAPVPIHPNGPVMAPSHKRSWNTVSLRQLKCQTHSIWCSY